MTQTPENRLKNSASPYLRSAAHQPIDWHEWGEEAFAKARAEEKPVLLDIGAVWCHWCHVIDRESYENPEIAAMINRLYIPVKVDRDERPDVDARYQSAVSAISGQGGWPLTAFLTPEGKPFFGGTYFPPEDAMGRPGFKRILLAIAEAFKTKRAEVDSSAHALEEAVAKAEIFHGARGAFDARVIDAVIESALGRFDATHGGFGHAPKFPHSSVIDLLLERAKSPDGAKLQSVAEKTLNGMAGGGFHDQIGGGFHRYSVDERWCVPHFEKMSYDNSELLKNYLHGYQSLRLPPYRLVAEGLIAWVGEVLSDQQRGGFYASQDADQTLDDDGDYFTWTQQELRAALSTEEAGVAELYYDVGPQGEMHHNPEKNVLWIAETIEGICHKLKLSEDEATLLLARAKGKLLTARRERRPTPTVDETLYVGWNAMFVSAYLEAARVLGRADCREFALKTLDRILAEAWDESKGFLHRVGGPRLEGSLDDQIFAAAALLDAYETTLDRRYFDIAERAMRLGRTLRRSRGRRLLRSREGRAADGRARNPPQAAPGFAHAGREFGGRDRARPAIRVHGRARVSRLGGKDARGIRRADPTIRHLRRDLRPRGSASCAPLAASGDHRSGGRPKASGTREGRARNLPLREGCDAGHTGAAGFGRSPSRAP